MVGPYFLMISFLIFVAIDVFPEPESPVIQKSIPLFLTILMTFDFLH
jgi:hypothetical protein